MIRDNREQQAAAMACGKLYCCMLLTSGKNWEWVVDYTTDSTTVAQNWYDSQCRSGKRVYKGNKLVAAK